MQLFSVSYALIQWMCFVCCIVWQSLRYQSICFSVFALTEACLQEIRPVVIHDPVTPVPQAQGAATCIFSLELFYAFCVLVLFLCASFPLIPDRSYMYLPQHCRLLSGLYLVLPGLFLRVLGKQQQYLVIRQPFKSVENCL